MGMTPQDPPTKENLNPLCGFHPSYYMYPTSQKQTTPSPTNLKMNLPPKLLERTIPCESINSHCPPLRFSVNSLNGPCMTAVHCNSYRNVTDGLVKSRDWSNSQPDSPETHFSTGFNRVGRSETHFPTGPNRVGGHKIHFPTGANRDSFRESQPVIFNRRLNPVAGWVIRAMVV